MSEEIKTIKVGSRASELAMIQTKHVISKLKHLHDGIDYDIESMETLGDKVLDKALNKIGSKSLFTKELEMALESKDVTMVVHSLKDLPTTMPDGMVVGAVCKREDPSDVIIMHPKTKTLKIKDLSEGAVIGTSSLRRSAQLKRNFPHLKFENIRGNLNTRLRKLEEGNQYSAIVLAAAGVKRMGWENKISQVLESSECMYAVGQGALAVECRQDDEDTLRLLAELNDNETVYCIVAERAFMRRLEGGCSVPLGVHTKLEKNRLTLKGGVWSLDGKTEIYGEYDSSLTSFDDNLGDNDSTNHNSLPSGKRSCEDKTEPSSKKSKVDVAEYCGISVYKKDISKIRKAYEIGLKLADMLIAKGAKAVLKESAPQLSKPQS